VAEGSDVRPAGAPAGPVDPIDGRNRRAVRSRQLIVDAFLDLLGEGHAQPTVQQVSQRSGVSMSTVWRLFEDVEAVHRVAIDTQIERVAALIVDVRPHGSVEQRIKRLVDSRAKLFEAITPIRRFAVRLAHTSAPIRRDLDVANTFFRDQLIGVFEAEIALSNDPRNAVELADAVTSWDAWERLRSTQGLSIRRAKAAVSMALLALFGSDDRGRAGR
jgi:AcrR family transcriptional regulator